MDGISSSSREKPPCIGCEACHGKCPKDARGERGFEAYRAEVDRINEARRKYNQKPYVGPYK